MIDTIAAPLAQALAARGYTTLTPVQEAVLAPEARGRDLLVSAQTGSGKTVAFGLAIAPDLIGDGLPLATAPAALIVAPTRELALQVRREFEWLYAGTGAQVASCVGGMDWRTERRALERGAAVVVGTPGRLRDHIERGSLDLTVLKAAVLDEADEMLDLGFAEDLEFILGAAPSARRTLMFSATVPKAIEALAGTFQRDALRIVAQGEARQHVDITYRALSVGAKDKENAVLNLLRLMEPRVAIVFAKTRAGVSHLMARMANRGLSVVALSGELSQAERTHALQSLRDGRARVCVATDVAARGIDLPGLELVVHFDLPTNSETLLHRSGRTGRAGAKGQAVLIVTPSDFRKAQRILQGAKVTAEWGKPPSADEVQAADDERLMAHDALAEPPTEDEAAMVARLASFGEEALAAAVLRLWRAGRAAPEELHEAPVSADTPAPVRERAEFGPAVWYTLSAGHDRRVEARWLLPKLCDAGGITRLAIGAIRVQADRSYVQIAEAAAARLEAGLGAGMALEEGLVLTRLAGEPDLTARPPRAAAPARSGPLPRAADRPQGPTWSPLGGDGDAAAAGRPRSRSADDRPVGATAGPRKTPAPRSAAADTPRAPYARKADPAATPSPRRPQGHGDARPARAGADADRDDRARKPYPTRAAAAERKPHAARSDADERPRKPDTGRPGDRPPRSARVPGSDRPRPPRAAQQDGPQRPGSARADRGPRPAASPERPRNPETGPASGAPPKKGRWSKDDPRRQTLRGDGVGPEAKPMRAKPFSPRAPKPPPPDPTDPSQSLRKRPGGASRTTKPGPRPGPRRG
ncbi:MAG: DEAD/DEAH box helicase [Gemmobacter sp.]